MRPAGRTFAELRLLAKIWFAAVAGGVLAMAVLVLLDYIDRERLLLLVMLTVAAAVLCVVAFAAMQPDSGADTVDNRGNGSPWPPRPAVPPSALPSMAPPGPRPRPSLGPPPGPAPGPPLQAAPPRAAGPQWYDDAAQHSATLRTLPAAPGAAAGTAGLPPSLESPVDQTPARFDEHRIAGRTGGRRRVVQCPRCAEFDIDVWDDKAGFAFGCRGCRHRWRWSPGTPWPPTVVRPALARTRPPTGPS